MTNPATHLFLEEAWAEFQKYWRLLALGMAGGTWLATRQALWWPEVALHYVALSMLLLLPVFWLAGRVTKSHVALGAGLAGVALLLLIYAGQETYVRRWKDVNEASYEDRHRRWGGALEHRKVRSVINDEPVFVEGPMFDGKRHGRWVERHQRPPREDSLWFWQDKQVSEDEWKRRNSPS